MDDHICKIEAYLLNSSKKKASFRCEVCCKKFDIIKAQEHIIKVFGDDNWHDEWNRIKDAHARFAIHWGRFHRSGFEYPLKIS